MGRTVVSARFVLGINFRFGGQESLRNAPRFLAADRYGTVINTLILFYPALIAYSPKNNLP